MDCHPAAVVPWLFAVGESACFSVHGANRLGSNSLIDLVVFGRATGFRIAELVKPNSKHGLVSTEADDKALSRLDHYRNAKGGTPTAQIRLDMQHTMQKHCAVFRDSALLNEGQRSEEHTSELQSLMRISYAVFCLKTKIKTRKTNTDQKNTRKK